MAPALVSPAQSPRPSGFGMDAARPFERSRGARCSHPRPQTALTNCVCCDVCSITQARGQACRLTNSFKRQGGAGGPANMHACTRNLQDAHLGRAGRAPRACQEVRHCSVRCRGRCSRGECPGSVAHIHTSAGACSACDAAAVGYRTRQRVAPLQSRGKRFGGGGTPGLQGLLTTSCRCGSRRGASRGIQDAQWAAHGESCLYPGGR
jgi:hypothetical protein